MKVTFRTNLGSIDAKALNLDHKKCQAGASLDVDKEVGEKLIATGVAVAAEDAKDDPIVQSAQGVPDVPEPEVKGVAKPAAVKGDPNFGKNPHDQTTKTPDKQ